MTTTTLPTTPFGAASTTPFGASTTAREVLEGVDLRGRRAVVTGAASGIGVETARALAGAGAEVTLAVRDREAGLRVASAITGSTGNPWLRVLPLDLADQRSVRAFVTAWEGPLHMLVGNAGVMASPLRRTREGWELQFATNHLGHFALATGLHPAMAGADGARVVAVSSSAHLRSDVGWDDVHFTRRPYDPWLAYGQSKTANVLFAVEAQRRWADHGITVNALMPGAIETNLQRHVDAAELDRLRAQLGGDGPAWKTAEQGAATSVLLAASPLVEGVGGRYFEDCQIAAPHRPGTRTGVAPYALDPEAAERLWAYSAAALG
jgi:NAD(P)-dependent dehydrogenase (short-subunit alcohol dehydrogenase family)